MACIRLHAVLKRVRFLSVGLPPNFGQRLIDTKDMKQREEYTVIWYSRKKKLRYFENILALNIRDAKKQAEKLLKSHNTKIAYLIGKNGVWEYF